MNLPIVASWSTRVDISAGAHIAIDGQLFLGYWPPKRGQDQGGLGPAQTQPTVLRLGEGSRFGTGGWVLLGPGMQTLVGPEARLSIGDGTYFTGNSELLCSREIRIGSRCAVAWRTLIMDSDFHALSSGNESRPQTTPVTIGDHVWIGAGAIILKGVEIGDGAVVAAGSVVADAVPPGSLVGGVPARVIRSEVNWD